MSKRGFPVFLKVIVRNDLNYINGVNGSYYKIQTRLLPSLTTQEFFLYKKIPTKQTNPEGNILKHKNKKYFFLPFLGKKI